MKLRLSWIALPALLSACAAEGGDAGNSAAPVDIAANGADQAEDAGASDVIASETVEGVVTGLQMGDYLWATIEIAGREPISAMPGDAPVDLFLNAHRGKPVTLEIATVRMHIPEAGGEQEVRQVVGARIDGVSAQAWWQGLSAAEQEAVRTRFEQGALSARGH